MAFIPRYDSQWVTVARLTISPRIPFLHVYLEWATKEILAGRRAAAASLWCIHVDADQLTHLVGGKQQLGLQHLYLPPLL